MASPSQPPLLLTPKPEPPEPVSDFLPNPNSVDSSTLLSDQFLDPIIAEYFRLANQYALNFGICGNEQNALALVPVEDSQPKKKKAKGNGMVRVPDLSNFDYLQFRARVRQTRLTYESLRSYFHGKYITDPNPIGTDTSKSRPRNRADLKASKKMRELGLFLHNEKDLRIVGPVPGIEIGDIFFYRAELMALGVHNQIQGGIGYVPSYLVPEGVPIATSIVASGGYQDDVELSDDVILYTGSGGRVKNQACVSSDQSLQRGNLALERSMQYGIEIRVIRGYIISQDPLKKLYIYDGLYRVVEYKKDKGKSGCHVYLFKLVRARNQAEPGTRSLRLAQEIKTEFSNQRIPHGYVSTDISGAIESLPVPFFNDIDNDEYPLKFEYIKSPQYPSLVRPMKGCQCKDACNASCACLKQNNGEMAYDSNGILIRGRPIVYECGDTCPCAATCLNRVTQNGIKVQLEVFRSSGNVWGVRSLDLIQAGSFICEFSGDVVVKEEAKTDPGLDLDLDPNRVLIDPKSFPERWREWGDVSSAFPNSGLVPKDPLLINQPCYFLDVSSRRNVACYVSHSASPNVFVQFVLYGQDDVKFPRMMIFAMENIPPLRELSLDYGVVC